MPKDEINQAQTPVSNEKLFTPREPSHRESLLRYISQREDYHLHRLQQLRALRQRLECSEDEDIASFAREYHEAMTTPVQY